MILPTPPGSWLILHLGRLMMMRMLRRKLPRRDMRVGRSSSGGRGSTLRQESARCQRCSRRYDLGSSLSLQMLGSTRSLPSPAALVLDMGSWGCWWTDEKQDPCMSTELMNPVEADPSTPPFIPFYHPIYIRRIVICSNSQCPHRSLAHRACDSSSKYSGCLTRSPICRLAKIPTPPLLPQARQPARGAWRRLRVGERPPSKTQRLGGGMGKLRRASRWRPSGHRVGGPSSTVERIWVSASCQAEATQRSLQLRGMKNCWS
jgi:hypothetical protein